MASQTQQQQQQQRPSDAELQQYTASEQTLWWQRCPQERQQYPPLGHDLDVDLAVVGGGILGITTALVYRRRFPNSRV